MTTSMNMKVRNIHDKISVHALRFSISPDTNSTEEDVRSKLQSKRPLSAQDLRTLDYSSILLMGEVAMDHPGLADLLVDRQDSLPVVRKVTGVAIKGGAASNTTVGFFTRIGKLKGALSDDAKRAAAGVVAAAESERNPVFSIVAKNAPEVAVEMPAKFVAGLSVFDVKGYALTEQFRYMKLNWARFKQCYQ